MSAPQITDVRIRKRRTHVKSRNGCLECKRRHQKCDEQNPRCGQCQRLKTKCSFEEIGYSDSLSPSLDSHMLVASSTPGASSVDPAGPTPVDIRDIELYNNFLLTLGEIYPELRWDTGQLQLFTKLALSRPYMLHALLALSGLQLYQANPCRHDLLARASELHSIALDLAKPHYTSFAQEESVAMLFFSGFTAIFAIAESAVSPDSDGSFNLLEKLLQSSQLVRGIRVLLAPHWQYLFTSWVGPILESSMAAGVESEAQSPFSQPDEHRALRSLAFGLEDKEQRRSCLKAIDNVFRYINALQDATDRKTSTRLILAWIVDIEPPLEDLIRQHKPVALIILAYYAVLMEYGSVDNWWVSSWPRMLMEYVDDRLDEEWEEFLAWPKSKLARSDRNQKT